MAKKTNKTEEVTDEVKTSVAEATLAKFMADHENVSIHKISKITNVTYGLILKKAKQPIANIPYDPEAINYAAVEDYLKTRGVNVRDLPWDEMNSNESKAVLIHDQEQFKPGMKVFLRGNKTTPVNILFKTETHIVFMLEGSTEPKSWSINTFMLNGPSMEPREEAPEVAGPVAEETPTAPCEQVAEESTDLETFEDQATL